MTSPRNAAAVRAKAWKTRRKKYGKHGHSGVYRSMPGELWHAKYKTCVAFLCRLYSEGTLSEGQVAKVTGLDRVTIRKIADSQHPEKP